MTSLKSIPDHAPLRELLNEEFWETGAYAVLWLCGVLAIVLSWA
jgi:hypothetical protein